MNDENAHQFLDLLLKVRRNCQRSGAPSEALQSLLRDCLTFVRDIMTDELFIRAMRTGDEGSGVMLLANRIALLEPLLTDNWPSDFSFDDLKEEFFAIANGDAPRLLNSKGKQGRFSNAHALLERKLEALAWHKVLRDLGLSASDRDWMLMGYYGISSSAPADWRKEARRKLGPEYLDDYLVESLQTKRFNAAQQKDPVAWAKDQVRAAGDNYKQKLKETRDLG